MSTGCGQAVACLLLAILVSTGCAETRHVLGERNIDKSGFLGAGLYDKMTAGDDSQLEPAFRWRDENVVYKQYTKIIIDPVILYRQPQHLGGGNTNENAQLLIDYLHSKIVEAFSRIMPVVERPGVGVARAQVALTDYEQSWVALDMVSTLYPAARVSSKPRHWPPRSPRSSEGRRSSSNFLTL